MLDIHNWILKLGGGWASALLALLLPTFLETLVTSHSRAEVQVGLSAAYTVVSILGEFRGLKWILPMGTQRYTFVLTCYYM